MNPNNIRPPQRAAPQYMHPPAQYNNPGAFRAGPRGGQRAGFRGNGGNLQDQLSPTACWGCGLEGHIRRLCPTNPSYPWRPNYTPNQQYPPQTPQPYPPAQTYPPPQYPPPNTQQTYPQPQQGQGQNVQGN